MTIVSIKLYFEFPLGWKKRILVTAADDSKAPESSDEQHHRLWRQIMLRIKPKAKRMPADMMPISIQELNVSNTRLSYPPCLRYGLAYYDSGSVAAGR